MDVDTFERIDGVIQTDSFVLEGYKFVVFADSSECMSCSISKMHKWNAFSDSLQSNYNISFMYILSPLHEEYENVCMQLQRKKLSYSVFLDKDNVFAKNNKNILSKSIYHVFLLDNNNKIVYLGDPRANRKLNKILFDNISILKK